MKPRATSDLDVVVGLGDFAGMALPLQALGYQKESVRLPHMTLEMFTKNDYGVDFIHLDHAEFERSILKRAVVQSSILGFPVRIISLEDLIIMKALSTRQKAQADLESLQQLPHDSTHVSNWLLALEAQSRH